MADFLDKAAAAVDAAKATLIGKEAVETKNDAFQKLADGQISKAAGLYARSIGEELNYQGGKAVDLGRAAIGALTSPFTSSSSGSNNKQSTPGNTNSPKR